MKKPLKISEAFLAVGGGVEPPTVRLAAAQKTDCGQPNILRLFLNHHPRDRRVWLPVSSSYNVAFGKLNNTKLIEMIIFCKFY